jgi:NADPH:quinone reductase-like Zn-dependent oxidoreductase
VRRITGDGGADIVIDSIAGDVLGQALGALAPNGSITTLGYSAGRSASIDVTDLIWKRATIKGFSLFAQPQAAWEETWHTIVPLLKSGAIKPIVAKTFPLAEAADGHADQKCDQQAQGYLQPGLPCHRCMLGLIGEGLRTGLRFGCRQSPRLENSFAYKRNALLAAASD